MKTLQIGTLNSYVIEPQGMPETIVVIMHGYGADGRDLIDIGAAWAHSMPNTVFISPNAPYPCEMSPMGRQWFSLAEYTIPAMEREIVGVWPILNAYLDAVLGHYNLTDDKMILSGFSQGCMMSLYALPRRAKPCAGILGYSGRLLSLSAIEGGKNTQTPIRLIHGNADNVVPPQSLYHARDTLTENGYTVTATMTPHLPHGIDPQGIQDGLRFIQDCFAA